jgi:hypothetical protein
MYASEKQLQNEAKHLKALIDDVAATRGEEIEYLFSLITAQNEKIKLLQEQVNFLRNSVEHE